MENATGRWMFEREKKLLNIGNLPWCDKHAPFKSRSSKPWSFWLPSSTQTRSMMVFWEKLYMEVNVTWLESQASHHKQISPLLG